MKAWFLVRSILSTPALVVDRFAKGWELGADMINLDLEDGVPFDRKDEAREKAMSFLKTRARDQLLAIRVNQFASKEGIKDLLAILETGCPPDAILLPKVQGPEDVLLTVRLFENEGQSVRILPVIEDASGLCHAAAIAACSPRVVGLIFGSADYCAEMEVDKTSSHLEFARQTIVVAANSAKVVPIDTPFFEIGDPEGLVRECRTSRQLGFRGKVLIHPSQIEAANQAFQPNAQSLVEARLVVKAAEASGGGIAVLNGNMIGPPFVKRARRVLEDAKRYEAQYAEQTN